MRWGVTLPDHGSRVAGNSKCCGGGRSFLEGREQPRCEGDPEQEEWPQATFPQIIVSQHFAQRALLKHESQEAFKRHRQTQPDDPDFKRCKLGGGWPCSNDEPDEAAHEQGPDQRRELLRPQLRHDFAIGQLAQRPVANRDGQHGEPQQEIAEHETVRVFQTMAESRWGEFLASRVLDVGRG